MITAVLGDLLTEASPGFASGDDLDQGVFQIRMNNLSRSGDLLLGERRRVAAGGAKVESCLLRRGDVLFNATNSPDLVGKTAYFDGCDEPVVYSNHFLRLRTSELLDPRYLTRWLQLQHQRGYFGAKAKQWVNQATFGADRLREVEIPLPPIEAQRRIAAVLDATDAVRAKRRQAITRLDSLAQSLLIEMFGSPGANPNGLPMASMIELVDPDRPITYGILKPGEDIPDGVPYVRVVDMVDGSIDEHALRRTTPEISTQYRRSLLRSGDVLMSIRGHVGRTAIVPAEVAGANITQDTARLAIVGAEPTYVLECLRSAEIQRWMATFTKGAAVRGINLTDVKKIPIPLPDRSDQRRFAERVGRASAKRLVHRRSLVQLDTLFESLQQRAFRGEL